ncbi:CRISPR-associated endonuclease Cas3'' [Streptacidiphilus fuscans]|uniref:CRISPR-associated endonuclease Cas3 n=1 Tax=Streptacidiphilus fuscans TaxID=2789292 RepID=A0A931B7K1_9ACTN|nr:CRISPR-associated endonuclease Cas3'' [Streptacidiphilus fuscans]MBF9071889.1 CRISPR-associated endonuclease Cas3'' [Streptacidiphilus fuscans]
MLSLVPEGEAARAAGVLWAHSRSPVSRRRHALEEHLRGSAALASAFGEVFGAGELAEYLALVHDVGKGSCAWQSGLVDRAEAGGGSVGVPHKEAGAWLAAQHAGVPFAAVVQGHHGGLPGFQELLDLLAELKGGSHQDQGLIEEAITRVEALVPQIRPAGRVPLPKWLVERNQNARLDLDLLLRMLFSCVVDADFLDTGAHFAGTTASPGESADMRALVARFEERRGRMLRQRAASPVDAVRQHVYEQAVTGAADKPGMYVLHVPTGGAKTLASAGFALHHAAAHGLRRVVVAVPFVSITQQNAQVYREMLNPGELGEWPVVLEHHSSVDLDDDYTAVWARTAAENWDAPFVVTTTVQLFESLFARKPAAMRKLHRLAGAVIVLDEVQALPDRLLVPILSGLRGLVERFGATVVLASATQPDFWALAQLDGTPRRQLVADPAQLFSALRRVSYEWRMGPDVTWESMAEEIVGSGVQTLTVVNTTKDAALLHRLLQEHASGLVLHLSTRMTAGHRCEAIEQVRALLASGEHVHVVSTQLIEAGVDVDFPRVFRAWAPAESLQQAAGRCNRDGRLVRGVVVVFQPQEAGQPTDAAYKAAMAATQALFGPGLHDPDDLQALGAYYPMRYALQGGGEARTMGAPIDGLREKGEFPAVTEAFAMIDDGHTQPVVVIRCEEDREAIEAGIAALRSPYPAGPESLRRLQPHTAALPRHEAEQALASGLADHVIGDLLVWRGPYDPLRGLDPQQREEPASSIV